jgi:hypothetical protein
MDGFGTLLDSDLAPLDGAKLLSDTVLGCPQNSRKSGDLAMMLSFLSDNVRHNPCQSVGLV